LRYGHRVSEDIDLFTENEFDNNEIEKLVRFYFINTDARSFSHTSYGIFCFLDDIRVDLMKWTEAWIDSSETIQDIRFASDKDIFPMKLQAAMTRGAKKDFLDIALLIEKHSLAKGLEWYRQKYPYNDAIIPVKSLLDFEIAEEQKTPLLLRSKSWEECKEIVTDAVKKIIAEK
jgi:hypothetical protein